MPKRIFPEELKYLRKDKPYNRWLFIFLIVGCSSNEDIF